MVIRYSLDNDISRALSLSVAFFHPFSLRNISINVCKWNQPNTNTPSFLFIKIKMIHRCAKIVFQAFKMIAMAISSKRMPYIPIRLHIFAAISFGGKRRKFQANDFLYHLKASRYWEGNEVLMVNTWLKLNANVCIVLYSHIPYVPGIFQV